MKIRHVLLLTLFSVLPLTVQAASDDGFGEDGLGVKSFSAKSTAALDNTPPDAAALNDIAPAAGGASDADSAKTTEDHAVQPAEDPNVTAEKDLEKSYGTEAERTVIDHGQGGTETRDTIGNGTVSIFQDQTSKGQVMDEDSRAGVQIKLLEFK